MTETRAELVGNRWMLVGGIVYLLEWVAIIGTGMVGLGSSPAARARASSSSPTQAMCTLPR